MRSSTCTSRSCAPRPLGTLTPAPYALGVLTPAPEISTRNLETETRNTKSGIPNAKHESSMFEDVEQEYLSLSKPDVLEALQYAFGNFFFFMTSGFRVLGSGFWVQGLGFRVQGSGFWVQGSGFWATSLLFFFTLKPRVE